MGFIDKMNAWADKVTEENRQKNERNFTIRRENLKEEIEKFIKKDSTSATSGYSELIDIFSTADVDDILKEYAPKLTCMITEVYLHLEELTHIHEIEGRYEELKTRYDELKDAYDKQSELLILLAKEK